MLYNLVWVIYNVYYVYFYPLSLLPGLRKIDFESTAYPGTGMNYIWLMHLSC